MVTRRFYHTIIAKFIAGIILLALIEVGLRIFGYQVYKPVITKIYSVPDTNLILHSQYGLALNPGIFTVTINDYLDYNATHLPDSTRSSAVDLDRKKEIHFYGCSLTYGMGLNDDQPYPALIQKILPDYRVMNYAVPGYGTIHGLMQLRKQLEKGIRPEMVILGYSSLHDARNLLTGIQQKYWAETIDQAVHTELTKARFPYARLKNNKLNIFFKPINEFSRAWAISKYSVFFYRLEMASSNIWYGFHDKYKLSEKIIKEMQSICVQYKVPFLVIGLDKSDSLVRLKSFAASQSLLFIDAGIDLYDPEMNLSPHDSHPNAKAHQFYADKLFPEIEPYFSNEISILN